MSLCYKTAYSLLSSSVFSFEAIFYAFDLHTVYILHTQGDPPLPICGCRVFKEESVQADGRKSRSCWDRFNGRKYPHPAGQRQRQGESFSLFFFAKIQLRYRTSLTCCCILLLGQTTSVCTSRELLQ